MKNTLLSFLFLCISFIAHSQEIYIDNTTLDTCLFLGGINVDNNKEIKVINNGKIVFKNLDSLTQTGLLTGKEFTDEVFKQGLCFELNGYEPFWSIRLFNDKIVVLDIESGKSVVSPVNLHTDIHSLSSAFFAMFSTKDCSIYGTINYTGLKADNLRICEYTIPENEISLFEVYVYMGGRIYRGCVTIKKYTE